LEYHFTGFFISKKYDGRVLGSVDISLHAEKELVSTIALLQSLVQSIEDKFFRLSSNQVTRSLQFPYEDMFTYFNVHYADPNRYRSGAFGWHSVSRDLMYNVIRGRGIVY
jgi:hypothetical protein